jgi:hypothetical protein
LDDASLLPYRLSQYVIDAVLPTRPLLLDVLKNVSIDAQRNEVDRWSFCRNCFEPAELLRVHPAFFVFCLPRWFAQLINHLWCEEYTARVHHRPCE